MSVPTVLVLAPGEDLHAHAISSAVRARGAEAIWLDCDLFTDVNLIDLRLVSKAQATIRLANGGRLVLDEAVTVWWRRPRIPRLSPDLGGWGTSYATTEWEHTLRALEPLSSCRWVNSPASQEKASSKALQLAEAKARGLRIPRTLITNDRASVEEFTGSEGRIIYKRVGSSRGALVATREFTEDDAFRLAALRQCPAMFQELIEAAADVRVFIAGKRLVAVEIASQDGVAPLDWRLDYSVPMRPHALDKLIEVKLLALLDRLELITGSVDLRLTPDGEYVFLEVNPSGQFLFADFLAQVDSCGCLVDELLLGSPMN
jgi:hypothetical protein